MVSAADILNAKILIVDDQDANVVLLEQMLHGAGYTAVSATSAPAEVCGRHLKHRYDLILLDLQMPGMDGFEVMEGLKKIEVDNYLPVLVITAQPNHKLRALKAGARDFVGKPFELAEVLLRVHNMIEIRLLHMETKRLYDKLLAEQRKAEILLLNVLPKPIAERIKGRMNFDDGGVPEVVPERFEEVSVLFADVVAFTVFSESVTIDVLLAVLNDIFSRFDKIAEARGLEKIKTSGDSYMVAAGVPIPAADHATRAAHMALDMMAAMADFNETSPHKLSVRIGIDTGSVAAGVIGKRKFVYDLWGDVVNTASLMESHGVPGRIQITNATRERLGEQFLFEQRDSIDVKGKGEMNTWFLNGANPVATGG